jgi:hypothetical protein
MNLCGDYGKNLHLNEVKGASIAVANDLTWTTERTRPLNLEKRKMSFILFHEIHNNFRGTDCKQYTYVYTSQHFLFSYMAARDHIVQI